MFAPFIDREDHSVGLNWDFGPAQLTLEFGSKLKPHLMLALNTGAKDDLRPFVQQVYFLVLKIGQPPISFYAGRVDFST